MGPDDALVTVDLDFDEGTAGFEPGCLACGPAMSAAKVCKSSARR